MQSSPLHVAIIMDGNGRWATRRGLPRTAGHRAGARAVRSTIESAPAAGIGVLTLYAFSSDNWNRPMPEVTAPTPSSAGDVAAAPIEGTTAESTSAAVTTYASGRAYG